MNEEKNFAFEIMMHISWQIFSQHHHNESGHYVLARPGVRVSFSIRSLGSNPILLIYQLCDLGQGMSPKSIFLHGNGETCISLVS